MIPAQVPRRLVARAILKVKQSRANHNCDARNGSYRAIAMKQQYRRCEKSLQYVEVASVGLLIRAAFSQHFAARAHTRLVEWHAKAKRVEWHSA